MPFKEIIVLQSVGQRGEIKDTMFNKEWGRRLIFTSVVGIGVRIFLINNKLKSNEDRFHIRLIDKATYF